MDEQRWQKIEQLFHEASALPPAQQGVWLKDACAGDAELEQDVLRLLAGDRSSEHAVRMLIAEASNDLLTGGLTVDAFHHARIGAWRIDRLLGEGGMGLVFLAHRDDGRFDQLAAIKLLRITLATPADQARFRRERRILARLEHPHIARLLDAGEHALGNGIEIPYFVMEHVDGRPLTEYAILHHLPVRDRVALFQQVLDAVGYAHQRFVLHRDLKPANILVTDRGEAKLLDFGIAQLLEGDPAATPDRTRSSLMTPAYASPEQLRGEPLTVQSDVFTLGALFYELLSERPPYEAPPMMPLADRAAAIDQSPAAPLGIDPDLDTVVAKAIHADLPRRYPSVEAFAADVRRYLTGLPISARRDSRWYRLRKFGARHRWPLGAAAVVMLSLAGGVVTTAAEARRANHHLEQLQQLSGKLLFQVHDAVESLQGATKARELLVTTSAEYLDGLSASAGNDPGFLKDLGAAYERLGKILGGPNAGHLGRPDEALVAYGKALGVYQQLASMTPADAELQERQSRTLVAMGRVQELNGKTDQAEQTLLQALEASRRGLAAGQPLPIATTEAMQYLGDHYFDKAQPRKALEYYQQALPAIEQRAAGETTIIGQRNISNIRLRIGQALIYIGNLPAAREEFEKTLASARERARDNPNAAAAQRDVYLMLDRLATVLGHPDYPNLGEPEAAVKLYDEAVATAERIAAADPQDMRARRDLAEMHASRAATWRTLDPDRSRQGYEHVFDLYKTLPDSMTRTPAVRQWLAQHHRGHALALARNARGDAAVAELDGALQTFRSFDASADIGITLTEIARLRLRGADVNRARAAVQESISILERTWRDAPDDVGQRSNLATAYLVMGDVSQALHDCEAARGWVQKSEALWRAVATTEAAAFVERQLASLPARRCG